MEAFWLVLLLPSFTDCHKFIIRTDHYALSWILNLADATCNLGWPRLNISEFELHIVHRGGIKNQAADTLLKLEKGGIDNIDLDDGLLDLRVSLSQHAVKKIRDVHNSNTDFIHLCQQCENTVETVKDAPQEVASIVHAATTHMKWKGTPRPGEYL